MALIFLAPLSDVYPFGVLSPHELESSVAPPVPKPILESHVTQSPWSFPRIPILALAEELELATTLNPSLLHPVCMEASEPISDFHLLRPSEVAWYVPSAISECRELACLPMETKLICCPILIPRQILEKFVFQYEGSLVSSMSNPVLPPARLYVFLSLHKKE